MDSGIAHTVEGVQQLGDKSKVTTKSLVALHSDYDSLAGQG